MYITDVIKDLFKRQNTDIVKLGMVTKPIRVKLFYGREGNILLYLVAHFPEIRRKIYNVQIALYENL